MGERLQGSRSPHFAGTFAGTYAGTLTAENGLLSCARADCGDLRGPFSILETKGEGERKRGMEIPPYLFTHTRTRKTRKRSPQVPATGEKRLSRGRQSRFFCGDLALRVPARSPQRSPQPGGVMEHLRITEVEFVRSSRAEERNGLVEVADA